MNEHATTPQFEVPHLGSVRDTARGITDYWWLLLVAGIGWIAASLVILQFDQASVTTVGILVGLLFLAIGIENVAMARLDLPMRWAWALFGGCSWFPPSSASPTRRTPSPGWLTRSGSCS